MRSVLPLLFIVYLTPATSQQVKLVDIHKTGISFEQKLTGLYQHGNKFELRPVQLILKEHEATNELYARPHTKSRANIKPYSIAPFYLTIDAKEQPLHVFNGLQQRKHIRGELGDPQLSNGLNNIITWEQKKKQYAIIPAELFNLIVFKLKFSNYTRIEVGGRSFMYLENLIGDPMQMQIDPSLLQLSDFPVLLWRGDLNEDGQSDFILDVSYNKDRGLFQGWTAKTLLLSQIDNARVTYQATYISAASPKKAQFNHTDYTSLEDYLTATAQFSKGLNTRISLNLAIDPKGAVLKARVKCNEADLIRPLEEALQLLVFTPSTLDNSGVYDFLTSNVNINTTIKVSELKDDSEAGDIYDLFVQSNNRQPNVIPGAVVCRIDSVEIGPDANDPEEIIIYGAFAKSYGGRRSLRYQPINYSRMYLSVNSNYPNRCKTDFLKMKAVAGTGKIVAWGGRINAEATLRDFNKPLGSAAAYTGYGWWTSLLIVDEHLAKRMPQYRPKYIEMLNGIAKSLKNFQANRAWITKVTQAQKRPIEIKQLEQKRQGVKTIYLLHSVPYSGKAISYYGNKNLQHERLYKNGVEVGPFISYHLNGQISSIVGMSEGRYQGLKRDFLDDGLLYLEYSYYSQMLHGVQRQYHGEENLTGLSYSVRNLETGPLVSWKANGYISQMKYTVDRQRVDIDNKILNMFQETQMERTKSIRVRKALGKHLGEDNLNYVMYIRTIPSMVVDTADNLSLHHYTFVGFNLGSGLEYTILLFHNEVGTLSQQLHTMLPAYDKKAEMITSKEAKDHLNKLGLQNIFSTDTIYKIDLSQDEVDNSWKTSFEFHEGKFVWKFEQTRNHTSHIYQRPVTVVAKRTILLNAATKEIISSSENIQQLVPINPFPIRPYKGLEQPHR